MSASVRNHIEQRFINLHAMPWSQDVPIVYEKFSNYCRAAALVLASEGNFNDAFSIASLIESIWVHNETQSMWIAFYTGMAKAVLIHERQREALAVVGGDQHLFKTLRKIGKHLSFSDASQLSFFLERCKRQSKI